MKLLEFNGTVFHRYRSKVSKVTENTYQPSQVTIDRRNQTIRQKKLKVTLATIKLKEDSDDR